MLMNDHPAEILELEDVIITKSERDFGRFSRLPGIVMTLFSACCVFWAPPRPEHVGIAEPPAHFWADGVPLAAGPSTPRPILEEARARDD